MPPNGNQTAAATRLRVFLAAHETALVAVLALLASVRIWIFCLAFPFFGNVDEIAHHDLIQKYARGESFPSGAVRYDPSTAADAVLYGSPEFFSPGIPPGPGLSLPAVVLREKLRDKLSYIPVNHQAKQAPLYYLCLGAWDRVLRAAGVADLPRLYGLRLLNAAFFAAFLLLSAHLLMLLIPGSVEQRLSVVALLALLPQDVFYSLNNDVMSPLLGAAAALSLVRAFLAPDPRRGFWAGFWAAAAFLVKPFNFPFVLLILVFLIADGKRRGTWVAAAGAAMVPCGAWMAWNVFQTGHLSGHAAFSGVLQARGWTRWVEDPLFSAAGAWEALGETLGSFWRGELFWKGARVAHPLADGIFGLLAAAGWAGAAADAWRRRGCCWETAVFFLAGSLGASLLFLSVAYEFSAGSGMHGREAYFVMGRYFSGLLAPMAALLVSGLRAWPLFRRVGEPATSAFLLSVMAALLASDLFLSIDVFHSPYNFFAFLRG